MIVVGPSLTRMNASDEVNAAGATMAQGSRRRSFASATRIGTMMLAVTVLLENSRCSAGHRQHDHERLRHHRDGRDLAEEHPREPARGAGLEDREPERQARDDQHQAAPLDLALGLLPRQHANARQEQAQTASQRHGFDRRGDLPVRSMPAAPAS